MTVLLRIFALSTAITIAAPSAFALTAEEVVAKLEANASKVKSIDIRVSYIAINRDMHGNLMQKLEGGKRFWCDKARRMVRIKTDDSTDEEVWDGEKKKLKKRISGQVIEEDFPPTIAAIEDVWPSPNYVFFPRWMLNSYGLTVGEDHGDHITLVGHFKGVSSAANGKTRLEFDVDVLKGVFLEVRVINQEDKIIERVRLQVYQRHGECWLPTVVRQRGVRQRNVVEMEFRYEVVGLNTVLSQDMTF